MQPAGIVRRFIANFVDLVFSFFLSALISFAVSFVPYLSNFMLFFLTGIPALFIIYQTVSVSLWGTTIGKRILNIRVLNKNGIKPSFATELLREAIFKLVSVIPLGIGFSWAVFSKDRAVWYDKYSETQVVLTSQPQKVTGEPGKFLKILSFIFLLAFLGFIEIQYLWRFYFFSLRSIVLPCLFQEGELLTESSHFKIYLEKGSKKLDSQSFKLMFEQAFDYSFWLISPLSSRTGTTSVCLYQNPQNFSSASRYHGGNSPSYAYFTPQDQTLHFSSEFTLADNDIQRRTVYHEVNHFVLYILLLDNKYRLIQDVPDYFNEGLAGLVQHLYLEEYESFSVSELKREVLTDPHSWTELSDFNKLKGSDATYYYNEGFLVMKFLEEKHGSEVFAKIIQSAVKSGQPVEKAIEEVTGNSIDLLEKEWLEWLK